MDELSQLSVSMQHDFMIAKKILKGTHEFEDRIELLFGPGHDSVSAICANYKFAAV